MTKVLVAQLNYASGDADLNCKKILAECVSASGMSADVAIFGRYSITGYMTESPPVPGEFVRFCESRVELLASATVGLHVLVGGISEKNGKINEAIYLLSGGISKKLLEIPAFSHDSSEKCTVFRVGSLSIAILLEEYALSAPTKTWLDAFDADMPAENVDLFLLLGRSPYGRYGLMHRNSESVIAKHKGFVYLNMLGGYGGNVFPGGSVLRSAEKINVFSLWEEDSQLLDLPPSGDSQFSVSKDGALVGKHKINPVSEGNVADSSGFSIYRPYNGKLTSLVQQIGHMPHSYEEFVYQLLILSLRDYVKKNAFSGVLLGLSGGVDSALVATLATDALGAENVRTFMLPTKYTSELSIDDAQNCATNLGVTHSVIHIEEIFLAYIKSWGTQFGTFKTDIAEENVQSRIRGTFLMAVSNITNFLLLATGNRSELLTGYMTLYGDTCGGFAPIKDVYKTQVYNLVRWRNKNVPRISMCRKTNVIPETVIKKAPTAELKFNQKDQDLLPEYNKLDKMLSMLIDRQLTKKDLMAAGYDEHEVELVVSLIKKSYFKLSQTAPGPCIMRSFENACNTVLD